MVVPFSKAEAPRDVESGPTPLTMSAQVYAFNAACAEMLRELWEKRFLAGEQPDPFDAGGPWG